MAPVLKRPATSAKVAKDVATKAAPPAAKRQKLDPVARAYQNVAAGLQQATGMPDHVREMILAMLEAALIMYKDERHELQESVVGMAGEVFAGSEAELVQVFDEATAAETRAEQAQEAAARLVQEAEKKVKERQEAAAVCKQSLTEHAVTFKEKTEAAKLAEASKESFASEVAAAMAQKEALSKGIEEQLEPLVAGVEAERVDELLKPLMATLKGLGLDQSIMLALPGALGKGPDARGPFDKLVAQNVSEELEKRVAALAERLAQQEPEKEARAAALVAAKDALEVAKQQQQQSAQALWDAQAELKAEAEKVDAMQLETKAAQKQLRAMAEEAAAAEKKLSTFRNGPLAAFTLLRDRVPEPESKKPEPEAPADQPRKEDVAQDTSEPMEVAAEIVVEAAEQKLAAGPEAEVAEQEAPKVEV